MANNIYLGNTVLGGGIQEAPMDGKLYARINGTWEEVDAIKKEHLNILLLTNQTNHSDLVGATITISYGGNTVTKTWNGNIVTVEVPAYIDYTISVSEVDGYLTPDNVEGTGVEGNSKSVLFEYKTEIVQISLSADNGLSISSTDVTIYEGDRSLVYHWAGTTIKHKVAYGKSYTISVGKVDNLGTPESLTSTADSLTKLFNFVYIQCVIKFIVTSDLEDDPIFDISPVGNLANCSTNEPISEFLETELIANVGDVYMFTVCLGNSTYSEYTFTVSDNVEYDFFEAPYNETYYKFTVQPGLNEIYIHFIPPIANGIYIVMPNGMCYPPSSSTSGAIGVAVVTDNCCFIMGLSYTSGVPWLSEAHDGWNTDIPNIPTSTNSSTIATYYNGVAYTNLIIDFANTAIVSSTLNCAAKNAKSHQISGTAADGTGSFSITGHLGSAGEWQAVIDNYSTVQTALTNAGGFTIDWNKDTFYWTSCEYSYSSAWCAIFRSSALYLDYNGKYAPYSSYCVVPFFKVKKSQLTLA